MVLLGSPKHRLGCSTGARCRVGQLQFVCRQVDDSALPQCPLLVWVKRALRAYGDSFVRLGNRPSTKVNKGPLVCRFNFLWRALQSVVGFEVGTARAYKYLSVSPAGFEDKNAFWIGAKNLSLGPMSFPKISSGLDSHCKVESSHH